MTSVQPSLTIADVIIVEPEVHDDRRGTFVETWRREWVPDAREMVQANRADRSEGTIVGLHYHLHQADFWYVTAGRARVVLHDLRIDSPTDGATESIDLGGDDIARHRGIYIPPGVAHGFSALSDVTITYMVDRTYDPNDELGLAWDDPEVAGDWGLTSPVLSDRDQANPLRSAIAHPLRPTHSGRP